MATYYRNESLFSEIYLDEITQESKTEEVSVSLKILREYRDFADKTNNEQWIESYIKEVLSALGFSVRKEKDEIFILSSLEKQDHPISICVILGPEEDLDNTLMGRNWMEKTIRALRKHNFEWGILTNGKYWRILHKSESLPYETFLEIDLDAILENQELNEYKIFHQFMKSRNFILDKENQCKFDLYKKDSKDKIDYIENELINALKPREEGGQGVLSDLCMGYVEKHRTQGLNDFKNQILRHKIYHGAMLYMFRLLFLFYADARDLLTDTNHDLLETIQKVSKEILLESPVKTNEISLWKQLEKIFVDIDQVYNGGLFSPQESEFTLFISEIPISNNYLANVVNRLSTYIEKSGETKSISYRDMNVRHLGTLYEGLLEHNLYVAEEETEVKVIKGKIQFIPVSKGGKIISGNYLKIGEVYFADDSEERRTSGSFFTPEDVVEFIVSSTVGEKLSSIKEKFLKKEEPNIFAYSNAIDKDEKRVLSSLIMDSLLSFVRNDVLNISILDPSMGSGHFLINSINTISNFITEVLNEFELKEKCETSTSYWRRWVVENCIFGVDINPLAVELAKLSIWILSMARSQPLSFINHHLKCGDSLVGCRLSEVGTYPGQKSKDTEKQLDLFYKDPEFESIVKDVISGYKEIRNQSSATLVQIIEKKSILDEIENKLRKYKVICDLHVGLFIEKLLTQEEYAQIIKNKDFEQAKNVIGDRKYFNWELEFPTQFLFDNGFDVVLGNPPYTEISEVYDPFFSHHYDSTKSKDLYTLFIEKMIEANKPDGHCSYVLPLSLTFSRNMSSIRKKIISQNHKSWKVASFDRIPDALFGGNVRTRCSILIGFPSEERSLYMTPMYRWFTHERNKLFSSIEYTKVNDILNYFDGWPKIGSNKQLEILEKFFKKQVNLGMIFKNSNDGFPIYYSSTAYNWLTITRKMPPIFDNSGNEIKQTKYGRIFLEKEEDTWFCLGILNSLFSYYFWLVYGDGFDVTRSLLSCIPVHPNIFGQNALDLLIELGISLQKEMQEFVVYKKNAGKLIGNYNLRLCRSVTDEVDRLILTEIGFGTNEFAEIQEFCNSMIKTEI